MKPWLDVNWEIWRSTASFGGQVNGLRSQVPSFHLFYQTENVLSFKGNVDKQTLKDIFHPTITWCKCPYFWTHRRLPKMSEQIIAGKTVQATAARLCVSALSSRICLYVFRSMLIKLILFSLSLGLVPITSFFVSQKYVWNGKHAHPFDIMTSLPRTTDR